MDGVPGRLFYTDLGTQKLPPLPVDDMPMVMLVHVWPGCTGPARSVLGITFKVC